MSLNCSTDTWTAQVTTGEKPPALSGHSLTIIDQCRAVLFGGWDGSYRRNETYTLDLDTWVCKCLTRSLCIQDRYDIIGGHAANFSGRGHEMYSIHFFIFVCILVFHLFTVRYGV